jgi:hypothetical protein
MHRQLGSLISSLALLALGAHAAGAQGSYPDRCGVAIPAEEAAGYVPIPRGDVFCPLVADPKAQRSFVSYLSGDSTALGTHVGSVGIGDRFGIARWGGARPGNGVQLSIGGSVFAQFDLGSSSFDLINADYLIGVPLTIRVGGFSTRLRAYHQSSHLGDEFLLRGDTTARRENLSFESAELILSQDVGPLRAYGGGEYLFHRAPETLEKLVGHGGIELRQPRPFVSLGPLASVRLVAAGDLKIARAQREITEGAASPPHTTQAWRPAISVRAGFEVGRPRDRAPVGRVWSLLAELYDGPSPYGQFYLDDIQTLGVGMHFTL